MIARRTKIIIEKSEGAVERISNKATRWIGSSASLIFHTIAFVGSFALYFFGVNFSTILLVVTTIVSLEAIYLAIFIQMSVNRQAQEIQEVSKDVEEIHENVEDIQEDVEEIQQDIDTIQEDVDEIQEDVEEIQEDVEDIQEDHEEMETHEERKTAPVDIGTLERIEQSLRELGKEISELKRQNTSN